MPSRRNDGTLIYTVFLFGSSMSEKTKVLEWINKQAGSGIQEMQDSTGKTIMQFLDRRTSVSKVIFRVYNSSIQERHQFKYRTLLKRSDAIIFVWDSLKDHWTENLRGIKELLTFYGEKLITTDNQPGLPMVVLATKRDQENIVDASQIRQVLDTAHLYKTLIYETIVLQGINIKRAFVYVGRSAVMNHYRKLSTNHELEQINTESKLVEEAFFEEFEVLDKIIFVSYSRKDDKIFQIPKVVNELRKYFSEVLYYEGADYDNIITYMNDNIERCDVFLSFWSQNALKSKFVDKEWKAADMGHKKIVPVFVDLKDVPFLLKPHLGVQFREGELSDNITEIYSTIKKQLAIS